VELKASLLHLSMQGSSLAVQTRRSVAPNCLCTYICCVCVRR
jgi:hypothetical protein